MERVAIHFLPESNMPNQGHRGESISSQEIMVDQMGTVHVTTAKVSFQGESRHTKQPAELSVTVRLEATSWKVASQLCILNRMLIFSLFIYFLKSFVVAWLTFSCLHLL
jgi:hypothetical protein